MVCKSRKEAMRRYLIMQEKMGWTNATSNTKNENVSEKSEKSDDRRKNPVR